MDLNESNELQEHQEHAAHDKSMRPVALLMAILAVLVAVTTLLGQRASTEAVLSQAHASDQWAEYQAKHIRQNETKLAIDLLDTLPVKNEAAAAQLKAKYQQHSATWAEELKATSDEARHHEAEGQLAERRLDRFDLGEALLEVGLVITSITLLTRRSMYALLGGVFAALGVLSAFSAMLLR